MKMNFIFCVFALFLLGAGYASGQQDSLFLLSGDDFPARFENDINKASKKIRKGKSLFEKVTRLNRKLEELRRVLSDRPVRLAQLEERVYRLQLKASTYFEDANRIQFRILKKYLKQVGTPEAIRNVNTEVKKQFRRSNVLRERAKKAIPLASPLAWLDEAYSIEVDALQNMISLNNNNEDRLPEPEQEMISEQLTVQPEPDKIGAIKQAGEIKAFVKPDSADYVEQRTRTPQTRDVFFSIQFLATRKPVTENQVKSVYSGELPVTEVKEAGWYKFSAGRFNTFDEAVAEMKRRNIYGFVVAFSRERRISIGEARRLPGNR
jgi:hypothetical protein